MKLPDQEPMSPEAIADKIINEWWENNIISTHVLMPKIAEAIREARKASAVVYPTLGDIDIASSEFIMDKSISEKDKSWFAFEAGIIWFKNEIKKLNPQLSGEDIGEGK